MTNPTEAEERVAAALDEPDEHEHSLFFCRGKTIHKRDLRSLLAQLAQARAERDQIERERQRTAHIAEQLEVRATTAERERDAARGKLMLFECDFPYSSRQMILNWKKEAADAHLAKQRAEVRADQLQRDLAEAREAHAPYAAVSAQAKGKDDDCWRGQNGAVIRYRDLRRSAALLQPIPEETP